MRCYEILYIVMQSVIECCDDFAPLPSKLPLQVHTSDWYLYDSKFAHSFSIDGVSMTAEPYYFVFGQRPVISPHHHLASPSVTILFPFEHASNEYAIASLMSPEFTTVAPLILCFEQLTRWHGYLGDVKAEG
jgi:hypothetical protein